MRRFRPLPIGALCLASCAVGPDYERPAVATPENYRGAEGEAQAESLADLAWWEIFQDPALQELVREALENNFDLRIAAARVEEARARAGIAKSFLFPEIAASGAGVANRVSRETEPPQDGGSADRTYQNWNLGFTLAWEIDVFGRIRRETESATATFFATEQARRAVWITLVADVAATYFGLLELDLELEIARRTLQSNDETVTFYRDRLEGGVSNQLELDQAIGNRSRTAATIPDLERRIAVEENRLNLLLGRNPGIIPRGSPLGEQALPPRIPAGLPSGLLDRRPDVRAAEDLLVSANADVGAAKALFYPTFSLTGLLGGASHDLSDLANSDARIWSAGAGFFQPLFQGGRLRRNLEAARARFDQAIEEYRRAAQSAFREVADALVTIEKLAEIQREQEAGVEALADATRLSRDRYDAGLSNYLEILIADQELFDAELLLAQTRGARLVALVELYRALGGGWTPAEASP